MEPITKIRIPFERTCQCPPNHINCLSAKEWVKSQVTIREFSYEGRDVRDKDIHPAVFPISLPKHFILLFTHKGELVLDPFAGIGTTLVAAKDTQRNAIGIDLKAGYANYAQRRLAQSTLYGDTKQMMISDNSLNLRKYIDDETVSLSLTSPPYANMLNRPRLNKSIRGDKRENKHYLKVQQYSANKEDLGTMNHEDFSSALTAIYTEIYHVMKPRGHVIVNINDVWENDRRYVTHAFVIDALEKAGFEFRNTIIWDKRNLVNNVGIFGWPSNFITLGTTMEFILDFWKR
ncbi:MAG: site-specific DNA-methyltransferase [Nitrososphaerota archaeon]|nr:site-specific DNA-methyltransferase [Nitrososphaerota archaeon]